MEDEKVKRAHEIGVNLAKAATNAEEAKYLGDPGICPHCHNREFYLNDDASKAICCLCGIEGDIRVVDGKVKFEFAPEQVGHAHNTMPGKFIHCDDIKENEGKLIEWKKIRRIQDSE